MRAAQERDKQIDQEVAALQPQIRAGQDRAIREKAAADREGLLRDADRYARQLQIDEEIMARLKKERAGRWFITGDLDERIARMELRLAESQSRAASARRALG